MCGAARPIGKGEGETVGGIVVMRYGMNALNVIDGVKAQASARSRPRCRRALKSSPAMIAPG